jgi:RNA recognition motif-containing protein
LKSRQGLMIKLYVVGYPLDIEEAELLEIFCFHGMVHSISLLRDKYSGQHKGFGFVEMTDQIGADRVIAAVNGLVIRGRKLTVKLADENRGEKPREFKPNRFGSDREQVAQQPTAETSKNKRPRKLVSNSFRADK